MTSTERTAYSCVRRGIAKTRAELSKVMDISRPTASTVADSLIAAGLLRDGGKCHSNGGRNPILLAVRPEAYSLIGVDLGRRDRVTGVWVNATGSIIHSGEIMMSPDNPDRAADAISRLWERFDPEFSADGLGLAVPGTINRETGCIEDCDHPCFDGDTLIKILRKRFVGKYFHVAPRVQMAAISENFGGAANLERNFILMELGETLEAMLYLNNRCFTGSHGRAGNLSAIPVTPYDGMDGCTLGEALSKDVMEAVGAAPEQIASMCVSGLRHVLSVIDVDLIVLAGRFSEFDEDFMPLFEHRLAKFNCRVKLACFGRFSASRGAALETHIGLQTD